MSLLEGPQDLVKAGTSGAAQNVPNSNTNGAEPPRPIDSRVEMSNGLIRQDPPESRLPCATVPVNHTTQKCIPSSIVGGVGCLKPPLVPHSSNVLPSRGSLPPRPVATETTAGRNGLSNIDLNSVYHDVEDYVENPTNSRPPVALGVGSHDHPSPVQCDSLKSSPPQTSRNSDSTSTQSPSSSSGEGQVYYFRNRDFFRYYLCIKEIMVFQMFVSDDFFCLNLFSWLMVSTIVVPKRALLPRASIGVYLSVPCTFSIVKGLFCIEKNLYTYWSLFVC
jgi:hypothetical protein